MPLASLLDEVTVLVLTFNEAPNIQRTLEKLSWAKEIVVVDSFSTDETLHIAQSFQQGRVVQRLPEIVLRVSEKVFRLPAWNPDRAGNCSATPLVTLLRQ